MNYETRSCSANPSSCRAGQAATKQTDAGIRATTMRDNSEVFTLKIDGTGIVQLTHNLNTDGENAWSPDGTKLAFASDKAAPREFMS